MAQPGDVIENPVQKYRVKFLETGGQTNGQLLKLEWTIEAGGQPFPWHMHLIQNEKMTVQSGQLGVRTGRMENIAVLNPGDEISVPSPTPHQFYNASETEPVTFLFDVMPAGQFGEFLESHFALARAGKVNKAGTPNDLLKAAVIADVADTYPVTSTFIAYIIKVVLRIVATFARLLGYRL